MTVLDAPKELEALAGFIESSLSVISIALLLHVVMDIPISKQANYAMMVIKITLMHVPMILMQVAHV